MTMAKLEISPPDDFVQEEVVTTWRAPLKKDLKAAKALQFQAPVRPNLIATHRRVSAKASLGELMAKVCADLVRHIDGLSDIETTEFEFKDGVVGLMLRYTMPVHGKFTIHQFQAGRMDGDIFTTLTISTEASRLDDTVLQSYVRTIGEASVKTAE